MSSLLELLQVPGFRAKRVELNSVLRAEILIKSVVTFFYDTVIFSLPMHLVKGLFGGGEGQTLGTGCSSASPGAQGFSPDSALDGGWSGLAHPLELAVRHSLLEVARGGLGWHLGTRVHWASHLPHLPRVVCSLEPHP